MRALVEARRRFEAILVIHMVLSMACQGVKGRVQTLATKAGLEGLQHELIKSQEGTAEFDLVRDLWQLSADRITVEDFLRRHGYHGPRKGLLESTVWREDSAPIVELAATYRTRRATEDVDQLVVRRRTEQAGAVRRLEQALGPIRSIPARALVRFAAHAPMWRETGRASLLRAVSPPTSPPTSLRRRPAKRWSTGGLTRWRALGSAAASLREPCASSTISTRRTSTRAPFWYVGQPIPAGLHCFHWPKRF